MDEPKEQIDAVTAEVGDRVASGPYRGVVTQASNYSLHVRWLHSGFETKTSRADAEAEGYVFSEGEGSRRADDTEGGV